jgi:hypothetical protein
MWKTHLLLLWKIHGSMAICGEKGKLIHSKCGKLHDFKKWISLWKTYPPKLWIMGDSLVACGKLENLSTLVWITRFIYRLLAGTNNP